MYDFVSTREDAVPDTIGRLVQGATLATISGPFDFTQYVTSIDMTERSSYFAQGTIQGNSILMNVADPSLQFDPVGGAQSRWLRQGNVVRVREGDSRNSRIISEQFTGSAASLPPLGTYSLVGRDVDRSGTIEVRQGTAAGTLLVEDVDYTVDDVAGTLTGLGTHWVDATDYFVTYTARDIPVQDWPITFTGTFVGRAGAEPRDRAGNSVLQLAAEDRTSSLLKSKITSQAFPQGTDLQFIMRDILETEVGMADAEFDLGSVGLANLTAHTVTQLVDESPMLSLAKIAFGEGFVPRFRGTGVLELQQSFSEQGTNITYDNVNMFEGFSRPFSPLEDANEVEVLGLDADLTEIPQPTQVLATAGVTMGFFGGDASIRVRWSDDDTQQARNARINIISSVQGALIPFGSSEEFDPDNDNDEGSRSGRIRVEGAFYAPLVTSLFAARLAASFIPDSFAGFGGGSTIPIGRIVEGVAAIAIALVQATIGRGEYEILGEPYEYVFQELRGVARVEGFETIDRRLISIENHLLDTQAKVDSVALRELKTTRKRGNVWGTVMKHDLRLEPGDKFLLPDARSFIVTEIQRSISRLGAEVASLALFETTFGVNP